MEGDERSGVARGLAGLGVALLIAAVLFVGFAAARVVQVVTCHGDTAQQNMTPSLARYCDSGWPSVAIGWPGALVAVGAFVAWRTATRWPLVLGALLGVATAVSPIAVVYVVD